MYDNILWLPKNVYTNEEIGIKSAGKYQHILTNYCGDGISAYQQTG